ncbi:type II secretion system F family protein [Clostridium aminobutyricum]|uniref:Type II secretion system F family protein n=1 Tax=Clostridium aminobutyricum TaxID=33953 RepID=A0A939D922_CLOAM|nr:type II secretion system F family protein [Clostridium aminobutyricum]MBN7773391.1 type II secretion system F family protein [Clostridium aminobutyricum]
MRARELSAFCMQISFLLDAGISLDGGLAIVAEDASTAKEKNMLMKMSEEVELGDSLATVLERTQEFPPYVVKMAQVGQETGTLEVVMRSLADYYDKESTMAENIKNAITYPMIMIFMLILVLFVLLTKVMPIFEGVYEQLGAQLSPLTKSAVQVGTIASGIALAVILTLGLSALFIAFFSRKGNQLKWTEQLIRLIKEKSSIAGMLAKRRFTAILAISIKSGLETDKGVEMAAELINQSKIHEKIVHCKEELVSGTNLYDALKATEIFKGMDLQMIKVGSRSGKLDAVFDQLSKTYEEEADQLIDSKIARFEPTMVIILAITVGLILLSVMMPLVGIMAAIG